MASSSVSSIQKRFKYDLFLSFRGEDTRKNFVDHLYAALQRQGIHTFKDDERLKKGKRIDKELIKAIEDSRLFIIVFSKTYASSSWCLDELVKIIECQNTTEQTAYPVFYDVEPTEVRKQSGLFGKAFAKHEFEESFGKWREALEEAAKLAGWELKNTSDGHEAKFIKQIVEEISLELRSIKFSVDEKLVGMESRIKDVELLLETSFDDVRMIGIKGMGGAGKTTLARTLFNKLSFHFEDKSFVENVREASQPSLTGLKSLQKQVLSEVLNDKDIDVNSVYDGKNMLKSRLSSRKVLLVLDDVDHIKQLEALVGEPASWFMAGSIIIISTRDEQVLVAHGVKQIHNVNLLSNDEATCLFSRYAFGRDTPIEGYEDLLLKVVSYAAGLPLTTKVLGSFLCGKDVLEWIDSLERLKTIPENVTTKILDLSYIVLEEDYKEIFLNVVCFMKYWKKDDAINVLECCGFHARTGLKVLEQKSLIIIYQNAYNELLIDVHDLIKELGKNIVRHLHPEEPSKHSRLWIHEEIHDVLANGLGTEATKYINLGDVGFCPEIFVNGFGNMEKLIFLNIYVRLKDECFSHNACYPYSTFEGGSSSNYMKIDQVRQYFPNSLRYLCWDGYHHWCLPKSFQANNLVALIMKRSRTKQLWEEGERKVMKKLKFIDFTDSVLKTLDLEMTPNLERLDLMSCKYLENLSTPSGYLPKLKSLCLSKSKLRTIDLQQALNLEMLNIDQECFELVEIHMPVQCLKLRSLRLSNIKLRALDLRMAQNLETVDLNACRDLAELHFPVKCLKLKSLNLKFLLKLRELNMGLAPNLEAFYFEECHDLVKFHMPVRYLNLKSIRIHLSKSTTVIDLGLTPNLEDLYLKECHNLVEFQEQNGCPKLKSLEIINSNLKTLNLRLAQDLEELRLKNCPDLVEFYMPVSCLKLKTLRLKCLDLSELQMPVECPALVCINISKLKLRSLDLALTPNLEILSISKCYDLEKFQLPNSCPKLKELCLEHLKLRTLDLQLNSNLDELRLKNLDELVELHMPVNGCSKLRILSLRHLKLRTLNLQLIPNLLRLDLDECDELMELHIPVNGCSKLGGLYFRHLKLRTLDLQLAPKLKILHLEECDELVELHMPINGYPKLTRLYLRQLKLRTLDLRLAPNLERLVLYECDELVALHMPVNGCLELKKLYLRHLKLRNLDLETAPKLELLRIEECHDLVQHNAPIACVKGLECIDLCGRSRLKSFLLYREWRSRAFHVSAESIDTCPLNTDHSLPKFRFSCLYDEQEQPSSTTRNLQKLVSLANCCIGNFTRFSESICGLQNLRQLTLHGSIPEMPKHLQQLEYLELLVLSSMETKHLPNSICMLKHLKALIIKSCLLLENLPEDIGRLECLEELMLNECTSLTDIPLSICKLKRLKNFNLALCTRVKKLPEDLGRLEGLIELNVKGTGIIRLPDSISLLKGLRVVGSAFLESRGFADLLVL